MGGTQSAEVPGGGTEGYHVLKVCISTGSVHIGYAMAGFITIIYRKCNFTEVFRYGPKVMTRFVAICAGIGQLSCGSRWFRDLL